MQIVYLSFTLINCYVFFGLMNGRHLMMSPMFGYAIFTVQHALNIQFLCVSMIILSAVEQTMRKFNRKFEEQLIASDDLSKQIKQFSIVYMKISRVCQKFSEYFLIANIFNLFASFLFISLWHYAVYVFIREPTPQNMIFIAFSTSWMVMMSNCFFFLIYFSCLIDYESKKTLEILQERFSSEVKHSEFKKLFIFSQQISHQRASITCGSFNLNLNYLFDLYAFVLTSAVVFIQFYGFNKLN